MGKPALAAPEAPSPGVFTCGACGGHESTPWVRTTDPTGRATGEFTLVRCAVCKSGALWPQPDDATLAAAYGHDYGPHGAPHEGGSKGRIPGGTPGRALVIGAGGGSNLTRLQAAGWEAVGVEPNPDAVARAREAGLDVVEGTAEAGPYPDGKFDMIWLPSVIEHLRDPRQAMWNLRGGLEEAGRLVIWTQNPESDSANRWGEDWVHLDPPRHLWHFTRIGLRLLAASAGLEPRSWVTQSRPRGHLTSMEIAARRAGQELDVHRSRWHKALARPRCWWADSRAAGDLQLAEFQPTASEACGDDPLRRSR